MIQNCAYCKGINFYSGIVCNRCRCNILYKKRKLQTKTILSNISTTFIWNWDEGDLFLEELHGLLKLSRGNKLAADIMQDHIQALPLHACFVAVPESQFSLAMVDHFSLWTQSKAHKELFWTHKIAPHKFLSRIDRLKSRMSSRSCIDNGLAYILIDDIVTTGATVKAAYEALSKPRDFRVWSLSCRT